jgi:hypothetical protein
MKIKYLINQSRSKHDWGTLLKHKDSFLRFLNSFFVHFFHDLSYISFFFFMSNKIVLFQILYRLLRYLLFSFMKIKIVKFIQCGPCFVNGSKFLRIWLFETFYITIGHLVLVKCIYFIHLNTQGVCDKKKLGQKKLFKHSLWILEFYFFM